MARVIIIFSLIFLLTGCTEEQKQKVRDVAHSLDEMKLKHCAENNAERRAALIAAIRAVEPLYPGDGACGVERKIHNIVDWVA